MHRTNLAVESAISNYYSDYDIQKYNGKSVSFSALFEPLFRESTVVAIFKVSSLRASDDVKLRSLLRSRGISMQRYKPKYLRLVKRMLNVILWKCWSIDMDEFNLNLDKTNVEAFLKFMEGSAIALFFDDIEHFLFFEKSLLLRLLKVRFEFYSLKVNDQNFFVSSSFFKTTLALSKSSEDGLLRMKNLAYFQLLVIRNFLFFLISLRYQSIWSAVQCSTKRE